MLRRAMVAFALAVVVVVVVGARAYADDVTLAYTAPGACPDRATVEAAVHERAPAVQFAAHAERTFAITIAERGDDYAGTLSVATAGRDDPSASRELSAHRCDDLAVALALVTALAIDPSGGAAVVHAVPPIPATPWRLDAALAGAVVTGVTPDAMPAVSIEARAAQHRAFVLALAAIAGYDRADAGDGAARFVWSALRPSACWRPITGSFELAGCGHAEVGLVRATGQDVVLGRSVTRAWLASGAHAEARWPTTSRVFMQLQAGISVPVLRDTYLFQPGTTIHQTAAVTEWVGGGVGVHFW